MSVELGAQIAVAILGLIAAILPYASARARRQAVQNDLHVVVELVQALPEQSTVRPKIEEHAELLAGRLIETQEHRRDPAGVALGLCLIIAAGFGGVLTIGAGGYWLWLLIPAALVGMIGVFGFAQDVTKVKRDSKGRPTD
jgi:hypothetical protein